MIAVTKNEREVTKVETAYSLHGLTLNHLHALNTVAKEWCDNHREDHSYVAEQVWDLMHEMADALHNA